MENSQLEHKNTEHSTPIVESEKTNAFNRQNENSPFSYLTKYRSELMGFAILWVVLFHSSIAFDEIPVKLIRIIGIGVKKIGYGGVDIFLLVSGLGIFQSLQKNSTSHYIKNRLKRILPIWWTWFVIYLVLGKFVFDVDFKMPEILGYATFTGFWLDMPHQGNWYVYAIMLIYLVSPVFYSLIQDGKNKTRTTVVLIIISIVVSLAFFYQWKLIVFSRIPIYLVGMYFTANLKNCSMNKAKWTACILIFLLGFVPLLLCFKFLGEYLWDWGLYWYPFILIAPTLSLLICKFFDVFQKMTKPLCLVLKTIGKASLEILLVSDFLYAYIQNLEWLQNAGTIKSVIVAVMGVVLGYVFHLMIDLEKAASQAIKNRLIKQ